MLLIEKESHSDTPIQANATLEWPCFISTDNGQLINNFVGIKSFIARG